MIELSGNRIFKKIFALGMVIIVFALLVLGWFFLRFKGNLYDNKRIKTKHLVESAVSILEYYAQKAGSKEIDLNEAKHAAQETVRSLRYDGSDYFFICDLNAVMLMHPFKLQDENKSWADIKDSKGVRFIWEMANAAKIRGEGFVDYLWTKPDAKKPSPKSSYVKLYAPWGWVVGSGIYVDDVEREVNKTFHIILGVGIVLLGLGGAFSFIIAKSISEPLTKLSLNLNEGSVQIAFAANQVSSASQQLVQGATEQASSLKDTSSFLDKMSAMTKQNADNALQANQLASEARTAAVQGDEAMFGVQKAMGAINESSDKISRIIKTIEEIAFQTNLLALNAAVEAARAGEHGKGFAVVAEEVRSLARRSAASAKDTAIMIEDSIIRVKGGTDIAKKAGESLKSITEGTKKVADIISEISVASKEQAEGIVQVTHSVSQMEQVTQLNASASKEVASSAIDLTGQAEALKGMVVGLQAVVNGQEGTDGIGERT